MASVAEQHKVESPTPAVTMPIRPPRELSLSHTRGMACLCSRHETSQQAAPTLEAPPARRHCGERLENEGVGAPLKRRRGWPSAPVAPCRAATPRTHARACWPRDPCGKMAACRQCFLFVSASLCGRTRARRPAQQPWPSAAPHSPLAPLPGTPPPPVSVPVGPLSAWRRPSTPSRRHGGNRAPAAPAATSPTSGDRPPPPLPSSRWGGARIHPPRVTTTRPRPGHGPTAARSVAVLRGVVARLARPRASPPPARRPPGGHDRGGGAPIGAPKRRHCEPGGALPAGLAQRRPGACVTLRRQPPGEGGCGGHEAVQPTPPPTPGPGPPTHTRRGTLSPRPYPPPARAGVSDGSTPTATHDGEGGRHHPWPPSVLHPLGWRGGGCGWGGGREGARGTTPLFFSLSPGPPDDEADTVGRLA